MLTIFVSSHVSSPSSIFSRAWCHRSPNSVSLEGSGFKPGTPRVRGRSFPPLAWPFSAAGQSATVLLLPSATASFSAVRSRRPLLNSHQIIPNIKNNRVLPSVLPHGVKPMPEYRIYKLDGNDRICSPSFVHNCNTDEDAIMIAREYLRSAAAVEIWEGSRRVCRLQPPEPDSPAQSHDLSKRGLYERRHERIEVEGRE